MPCYIAGYVLWAIVTTEPLTAGLWVVSGAIAAFLVSRLGSRTRLSLAALRLSILLVLAIAAGVPLAHSLSEMHAGIGDAGLVVMGLLAAAVASVVLALLARLLGRRWHAALRQEGSESDHRRFAMAMAVGVFVPLFGFLAFFYVGMALTG